MTLITKKIKRYLRGKFRSDLSAGLTVAMVVIPQSMAYAAIVGINPVFGLFTAIIPTIIAAIFGSFPFLITGPTNPTALVTASVLLPYATRPDYFEFVVALAIFSGIINLSFGLLKMGFLSRYISNSVLVGFLTAVGILVIINQLGSLLGLQLIRAGGSWGAITQIVSNFTDINPYALIIGVLSIGIMLTVRSLNKNLPAALMTIVIASLLVFFTGWSGEQNVRIVSDTGLPDRIALGFHLPDIPTSELTSLALSGVAVALFGFMETVSISKSMSQMSGKPFNPSREMIGQGLACFVGGFFQCIPSSGSPSRTVMNVVNGAKTRFASIFSGLSVLIFLLLFSRLISFIPIPALAAVVIISAAGLININLIKMTWQSHLKSGVAMAITFASALTLPLQYAIYLGILSTILIYLGEKSRVNLSYLVVDENGHYHELPMEKIKEEKSDIAIVNIEGDLYFAAAEDLKTQIESILETDLQVLILRFRRTHLLASTGIMTLDQLLQSAQKKGVKVLFCGLQNEVLEPLQDAGLTEILGESSFFLAEDQLFSSTQRALEQANKIIKNDPC
jgi:SulP family sulfate permease